MSLFLILLCAFCLSLSVSTSADEKWDIRASELIGTDRGTFWSDEQIFLKNGLITGIDIASSKTLNGFRIRYGKHWGPWHGGTAGDRKIYEIEDITSVRGTEHQGKQSSTSHVLSIKFNTSSGKQFGPFGHLEEDDKEYNERFEGCHLAFMSGYTGAVNWLLKMKGLVFHWACGLTKQETSTSIEDTGAIGSVNGHFWSDEDAFLRNEEINGLEILSSKSINGLRARYGNTWGKWHGGTSGSKSFVDMTSILSIKGKEVKDSSISSGYVVSMEFTARNGSRYGPFGDPDGNGQIYNKNLTGRHLAFISGYTGAVNWLLKVTGVNFHWKGEE